MASRPYRKSPVTQREMDLMVKMAKRPWVYSDPIESISGRESILLGRLKKKGLVLRKEDGGHILSSTGQTMVGVYLLMTE